VAKKQTIKYIARGNWHEQNLNLRDISVGVSTATKFLLDSRFNLNEAPFGIIEATRLLTIVPNTGLSGGRPAERPESSEPPNSSEP